MSRLPEIKRDELAPEGQGIWDAISATRSGVHGPYSVLIRLPKLADSVAALGDYFREHGSLTAAERELAILAAAREMKSSYEWHQHEPKAREAGVRNQAIDAVRKMSFQNLNDHELLLVEVVQTLFRTNTLPKALFDKAVREVGQEKLVELVALSGFYCMVGFVLSGFDVAVPGGMPPLF